VLHRYGPEADRYGELTGPPAGPVVMLVHGGFWRPAYTLELMRPLAVDLAARGYAAWNVEYRRAGWPVAALDVAAGLDALAGLPVDTTRVVVVGHSAGGHLALWLAARAGLPVGAAGARPAVRPRAVVSLAGVTDLIAAARDRIGTDAVREFLGAGPEEEPERYRLASPAARLPLGIAQLLVHGDADDRVPVAYSRAYAAAAAVAGDPVELVELAGVDHFAVIDPASDAWAEVVRRLPALLG
jgi:acetyl esterase/lipase